jgi:nicotinamide-nucleotide amidase
VPDGTGPAARAVHALSTAGLSAATAESLTGGLIAAALTDVPGSSAVFRGAVVSYDVAAKEHLLGVPRELLQARGPVDADVAAWMARGACLALGADAAVSATGVAGPEPHGGQEPGLVFWGWRFGDAQGVVRGRLPGGRREVRGGAVGVALQILIHGATSGSVPVDRIIGGGDLSDCDVRLPE